MNVFVEISRHKCHKRHKPRRSKTLGRDTSQNKVSRFDLKCHVFGFCEEKRLTEGKCFDGRHAMGEDLGGIDGGVKGHKKPAHGHWSGKGVWCGGGEGVIAARKRPFAHFPFGDEAIPQPGPQPKRYGRGTSEPWGQK